MTRNPLTTLAEAAADWISRPLTPEVEHHARRAVLDWFAALLPGCVDGPALLLAPALASERGSGRAVSYVDGGLGAPRHASMLNGTASHTAEFDDIFRDGGYHPGSPTISAALAVAQDVGATQEQFLRAVIGGFEVGCRIAMALQPSHYRNWHITATVGTFGAAVSTAMLRGGKAETIAHAIAIASSFAGGHQENLQGEGVTKPMHAGHAADAGVLAGLAAAAGVTGSPNSLHAPHGYAAATSDTTGDWEKGLEGLGEWTPITKMTFKNHGCCGHIFPTLDGLRVLQAEHGFTRDDIASIHVRGYGPTKSICDRMQVNSPRDARFSLQYCAAALLTLGGVRLAAFTPEALADPGIRAFMPRVTIAEDPEIAALYPSRRQARLRVELTDGRVFDHYQQTRKGDPDDPLTDAELIEKFDELASTVLDADARAALKALVLDGGALPGVLPFDRSLPAPR
ncbi:MmgE/PrpD family protein [Frigidibacter albus]|uniref:MmgE/PrpD family protein n=1 Tax=Frigidibacter albus TaxID=1465486 RepID=A0A6L8VB85_9RHOB|nr:MmgE/PrpD family protein [Frigidibacter albus]MZQ87524.1 MmgE/PrpD family protein [Frigidibacter albus]NBE29430.1 MmgE/PrpD family protein [Frigidibacter albus]GGH44965.1 2-methylcitrate dehydratase [Frigidibacter albus]